MKGTTDGIATEIAITILAVLTVLFFFLAIIADQNGRSRDEKLGALIPFFLAAICGGIDGLLILGYAMSKLFA
jgi:hypothetical protein